MERDGKKRRRRRSKEEGGKMMNEEDTQDGVMERSGRGSIDG